MLAKLLFWFQTKPSFYNDDYGYRLEVVSYNIKTDRVTLNRLFRGKLLNTERMSREEFLAHDEFGYVKG